MPMTETLLVKLPTGARARLLAVAEPQCLYPADLVRRAILRVLAEEEAKAPPAPAEDEARRT